VPKDTHGTDIGTGDKTRATNERCTDVGYDRTVATLDWSGTENKRFGNKKR
jgi:hypothetical protein